MKWVVSLLFACALCFPSGGRADSEIDRIIDEAISTHNNKSEIKISRSPEVKRFLYRYLFDESSRKDLIDSLKRMRPFEDYLREKINDRELPEELLAIPIVETDTETF